MSRELDRMLGEQLELYRRLLEWAGKIPGPAGGAVLAWVQQKQIFLQQIEERESRIRPLLAAWKEGTDREASGEAAIREKVQEKAKLLEQLISREEVSSRWMEERRRELGNSGQALIDRKKAARAYGQDRDGGESRYCDHTE